MLYGKKAAVCRKAGRQLHAAEQKLRQLYAAKQKMQLCAAQQQGSGVVKSKKGSSTLHSVTIQGAAGGVEQSSAQVHLGGEGAGALLYLKGSKGPAYPP
jgi:hypothetical protein